MTVSPVRLFRFVRDREAGEGKVRRIERLPISARENASADRDSA
jgi:hypothetical protein